MATATVISTAAIRQRNGQGNLLTLTGDRPAPFDPLATNKGGGAIQARSNGKVTNLTIRNFKHVVRPFETPGATFDKITLKGLTVENVYRLLETNGGIGQTLTNLLIEDVTINGFERSAARLLNVTGGVIRRLKAIGGQLGDPFAMGLHIESNCHGILVDACEVSECHDSRGQGYINGDGFADEGNCDGIEYRSCISRNNSDAGFDVKSNPKFTGLCIASGNQRNWRIWNGADASTGTLRSENPRGQHFWTEGQDGSGDALPVIHIGKAVVRGGNAGATAVFRNEDGPAQWIVDDYDIEGVAGLVLHQSTYGMPITWGSGYYTGADGIRTFYQGKPPTGSGGVLL